MDILEEIVAYKVEELQERMDFIPPRRLCSLVEEKIKKETSAPTSMRQALIDSPTGIIAEFKRKSPSKGWIKQEGKASVIPLSYQQHGAAALSILTDTKYFGGYDEYIQQGRAVGVTIPILYTLSSTNISSSKPATVALRPYCSSLPAWKRTSAATSCTWHTSSDWRCCWRCTARRTSNTPT